MIHPARAAAVLVAGLVAAAGLSGAAAAPSAPTAAFCIPIPFLVTCDTDAGTPSPTPTPTGTKTPGAGGSLIPGILDPGTLDPGTLDLGTETPVPAPEPTAPAPADAVPDDTAPIFTQPPAPMGSESLSFTGLKGISVVTVPLADGTRTTAVKISADSITIDGFSLTVGHFEGAGLVTTADRMTLQGNVSVYLDSLTATTASGESLTLGADTPPPKDGIEPTLLRVTFGLVGARADSISYSQTDQRMAE
ncbi:MAG: hypothetical protein NT132_14030 [Microbacterium sp.]|uniref:hypothetical protein n=1 Tax=Microbacterium sp. TaxID=51671 RepID=UPI0026363BDE|nr:hypothetical protein [Microbacterium sp.]MCX6503494.1 hypothetical protein [Microbacterium sp.]